MSTPGPPTKEELIAVYPPKFTWEQLKIFVNSGDLGLLKRDKALQRRYDAWAVGIKEKHGSMVEYLQNYRLQWGQPDTISRLKSSVQDILTDEDDNIPYFAAHAPRSTTSIISNDWPYSVPTFIEHSLVWTKLPIFHSDIIHPSIAARIEQDGIWGFTGAPAPDSSPATLHACLPALADWGVTADKMIYTRRGTGEEEELVKKAGEGVAGFVRSRWLENQWETAWFVNPPRLQSVLGLAHVHVFARRKEIVSENADDKLEI